MSTETDAAGREQGPAAVTKLPPAPWNRDELPEWVQLYDGGTVTRISHPAQGDETRKRGIYMEWLTAAGYSLASEVGATDGFPWGYRIYQGTGRYSTNDDRPEFLLDVRLGKDLWTHFAPARPSDLMDLLSRWAPLFGVFRR